ncbi:mitochondrial sodium/calcium exchanger protein isoform X2 [Sylvia atricapilla]|uniref:mitochondrial sodium/calcium exchanger protein isoform X2 n=1 Tax=Sylvia atricapilla TaxID=48155 RepID=UPI003392EFF3
MGQGTTGLAGVLSLAGALPAGSPLLLDVEHTLPPGGDALSHGRGLDCWAVRKRNSSEWCHFIRSNPDCQLDGGFLDYLDGVFCVFPPRLLPLAVTLYALWLLYLFIILGVTAEKFFCPNLSAISTNLKLSHNVAGVTFLAFGNGAPDVFSAVVAFSDPRTAGLAIGAIFGAGVFVTTVVAGGIALVKPFTAASRPFLRDVIFYMVAVFVTFVVLYVGRIRLGEALGYLGLYVFYVLTVVLCTWLHRRQRGEGMAPPGPWEPEMPTDVEEPEQSSTNSGDYGEEYRPLLPSQEPSLRILTAALSPLDYRKWRRKPWYWRLFKAFKVPVELVLLLTVPVVDPDKDDRNWKRPLNCLHILTSPLLCVLTLKSGACVCLPWLFGQCHVDQRRGHRAGEHPADPGHHLPAQQHRAGPDPAGLGQQHRGHLLRPHHGPPGLSPHGLLRLLRGHHLQHPGRRGPGLPAADDQQPATGEAGA